MKKFQGRRVPRPRMKNTIPTKQPLLVDTGKTGVSTGLFTHEGESEVAHRSTGGLVRTSILTLEVKSVDDSEDDSHTTRAAHNKLQPASHSFSPLMEDQTSNQNPTH